MVKLGNPVNSFILLTVAALILLYTDSTASFKTTVAKREVLEDVTALTFNADENRLDLLPLEPPGMLREPVGVVFSRKNSDSSLGLNSSSPRQVPDAASEMCKPNDMQEPRDSHTALLHASDANLARMHVQLTQQTSGKVAFRALLMPDAQQIRAKVYLSLPAAKANAHFERELRLRIKEVKRALADFSKGLDLPKTAIEKLKAVEQTLAKVKQIQDDCFTAVKKQETLEGTQQYHYLDNVLATSAVVSSTITNATRPSKHVTDRLNYEGDDTFFTNLLTVLVGVVSAIFMELTVAMAKNLIMTRI